jgi:hypothetical protein
VDDDQAHRIIRPYGYAANDPQFGVLLTKIESPPIPIDVMEDSDLVKKLEDHQELPEEEGEQDDLPVLQKTNGFMESIRGSLATLKIGEELRRGPSFAGKNVLSKLFRNSSSSSTIHKSPVTDNDDYDDDLDDDDDDDDEIMDTDIAESIELNENTGTVDESGIFVDQNYSDVNNTAHFSNGDKFTFDANESNDDLVLDSDFSDDDDEITDGTFQSSVGPSIMYPKKSPITPSRTTNRKLSFDKLIKPKIKKRSESLIQRKSSVSHSLKLSRSVSNVLDSTIYDSAIFSKIEITQKPMGRSNLTDMIGKTLKVSDKDPLESFLFVSSDTVSNKDDVLDLKVWLPHEESINLKVRKSVRVFDIIGYVLYCVSKQSSETLNERLKDPNRWCGKLVDEDGEPYEGSFGLMDRLKSIGSYGEDEMAICEVTDLDYGINQRRTPLELKSSPARNQNSYYKSILPRVHNDIHDAKEVKVQVFEYPYNPQSHNYISFELLITDKLNDILTKYSRVKNILPTDHVLKAVGENFILDLNDSLSSLDENYTLEILTKKRARELRLQKKKMMDASTLPTINSNLTPQTLVMKSTLPEDKSQRLSQQRESSSRANSLTKQFPSSLRNRNMFRLQQSSPIVPNDINTEYHKFTVWRRLPMSFINRHERTLALDGEYVYIMPKDEKLWYDTNFKTTTFHVSQIMSCKVSRRVPSNFKIVVMKTSGPKRYVFEAINSNEAQEIINKLQNLMLAYKMNTSSLT